MPNSSTSKQPAYILAILIFAGELVFLLPFVIPRIFRPTYLDVFGINNLQLGTCYSTYGIVAMISYFFGGIVADKFQPRKLMSIALLLTALGGFYTSTFPSIETLHVIYGYWGCTTILLFWAAMIKATREWGGTSKQGRAFGFLDGGRGLVAAGIGTAGVFIFSLFLGEVADVQMEDRQRAFRQVILFSSFLVVIIAVVVWFFLKSGNNQGKINDTEKYSSANLKTVLNLRSVWLLMLIILSGYVGYKITDDFSLYAKEVMLYDEVQAAQIGTLLLYLRPIVGVSAGLLADRSRSSLWMTIGFLLMFVGAVLMSSGLITDATILLFFISIVATSLGVFAIRSLYFAAMEEGNIPLAVTGTAVGVISLIGYTPDIFVGPVMGHLLDSSPGALGHQHVFMFLAVFSLLGLLLSFIFMKKNAKI